MKKLVSLLLILCMLLSVATFQVIAKDDNFVPVGSATFEEGESVWTVLGGGNVKVVNNPTGEGKVLVYTGNPNKSYASPQIDVRPFIVENVSEETTVYASVDVFSKNNDIIGPLIRLRTTTAEGYSKCTEADKNYCTVGNLETYSGEWTRITFSFDVAEEDLISEEPWNICFDNLSKYTLEAFYLDNFYVGLEEECPYEENENNEIESGEEDSEEAKNFLNEANSTFESDGATWAILGKGSVSVVDNPAGEGKVLCYGDLDPSVSYASPRLDVRPYIQKYVDEEVTIYGSMDIYCEKDIAGALIRLRTSTPEGFSMCEAEDKNYCSVGTAGAMAGEWTTVSFSLEIYESDLESKEPWNICFDGIAKNLSPEDKIYIDNVYIGTSPAEGKGVENQPIPEKTQVSRFDETLVGTIRWDAFTESTPDGMNPSSQVARVLSPAKYHKQAPFFSVVNEDGTISFPEYTVETWEKEAEYAINGGLDYFAYLWYETTDDMSQPRKMHLQSEKKDTIKMCGVLEGFRSPKSMSELYEAMKDSCYLRVDGRPVIFLYGIGDYEDKWTDKTVAKLRQEAVNAGVKESLYVVGMYFTDNTAKFLNCVAKGVDAMSWYSVSAYSTAEPYSVLVERCEKTMEKMGGFALATNVDIIPAFTTGRDTRARIETGVTWVDGDPKATEDKDKPYANKYTLECTIEELEAHMAKVIHYTNSTPNSKTNMVLSYGWNEHEEGGWLCPTITVDENGNPVYNEDGTIKANTERLDALKRAKESVLNGTYNSGNSGEAEATPTAEGTVPPTDASGFNPLFVIIPAAIVVIGAAVAVIALKKKKD